ncbi:MAG: sigma-70 family RNA polymerase sigma factor [Planctomycetota bacterium]|nr:MAG: sigma-70 family RNA polymerase sigma factor [Planctomycetota bacterium]
MAAFQSTWWTMIERAGRGDPDAALEFARRYQPAVIAFVRRMGVPAGEAEDLTQEVMLRVFCRGVLDRIDPSRGRFRNLMCAVARNVVRNYRERQRAGKRAAIVQSLDALQADIADAVDEPDFDREWVRHLLDRALDRLRTQYPQYHAALTAAVDSDEPRDRLAARLNLSPQQFKNALHRGKQKLAQFLRGEIREYAAGPQDYSAELRHVAGLLDHPADDES